MHPSVRQVVALRDRTAPYAFYADFLNNVLYKGSGGRVHDAASLPGYSYTRSGAKSELDASGSPLAFAANVPGIVPGVGFWARFALTNLFLNSEVGVTQSVTVTAQAYTLSFFGTGTITLSGVSTAGPLVGTGTGNRVSLTFTPTAGSLTLTVSGSCTNVGLVAGSQAGPVIVTTGSAATVGADVLQSASVITSDADFVAVAAGNFQSAADGVNNNVLLYVSDGTGNNRFGLYRTTAGVIVGLVRAGGVTNDPANASSTVTTGRAVLALRRRSGKWTFAQTIPAGTVTVCAEGGATSFPSGLNRLDIGNLLGGSIANAPIQFVGFKLGTFSDADLSAMLSAL